MKVLVDSSIWVAYFRTGNREEILDNLIDENLIVTNELILTELVPFLKVQNKLRLIRHLQAIEKLTLNIDWDYIIDLQTKCLKKGINGIGIPDLIIAQNAIEHKAIVFTEDKHFLALKKVSPLSTYT
jgi:predicted nucleic acid-binding protein